MGFPIHSPVYKFPWMGRKEPVSPDRSSHFKLRILSSEQGLNDWMRGYDWCLPACPIRNARNKIEALFLVSTRSNLWHSIPLVYMYYLQSDPRSARTMASSPCVNQWKQWMIPVSHSSLVAELRLQLIPGQSCHTALCLSRIRPALSKYCSLFKSTTHALFGDITFWGKWSSWPYSAPNFALEIRWIKDRLTKERQAGVCLLTCTPCGRTHGSTQRWVTQRDSENLGLHSVLTNE